MSSSQSGPLIYLVDDDAEIRRILKHFLERNGYEVIGLATADELLHRLQRRRGDLILLDVMLPGTQGLSALQNLREDKDDVPVILLTARGLESDRIEGLNRGADDYITKPFSAHELLARIRAVLRRQSPTRARSPQGEDPICIGEFVVDRKNRSLRKGQQTIALKQSELALLGVLVSHPMRPLSRDRLMALTGSRSVDKPSRLIDVQIVTLRKILEDDPVRPRIIQTVRGVGYVFIPPDHA
jgi:two-component system phosphate regulon response regulator OmpR